MVQFLKQVAQHYYSEGKIDTKCMIFPNRRSMVFFKKHLQDLVKENSSSPVILPQMYTINDFFYKLYGVSPTDKVTLLLELYNCYKDLNPKAESLDEFIFWGDIILSDFSDVDKYLANPEHLFQNVVDFKEIQGDYTFLSPTQREAIENFVKHFKDKDGKLTVDLGTENPNVKEKFLQIWDLLHPLYISFNDSLRAKDMAYDGMVYREIADRMKIESAVNVLSDVFPNVDAFVFIGLNALNECEKMTLKKIREAGLGQFCWDYSGDMIKNKDNKSSFFMSDNVYQFPQAFELDPEPLPQTEFNVISVPSSVGQAKQIPSILSKVEDNQDCAIILPDEGLLVPVLNTIPTEIEDINVTMGYPLTGSAFYSLMNAVLAMQLHTRKRKDEWFFYHAQVRSIFSNSVFRKAISEEGEKKVKDIISGTKYYIPASDLTGEPVFDTVFSVAVLDPKSTSKDQIRIVAAYLKNVVSKLACALGDDPEFLMEVEFARKYYQDIQQLERNELEILPVTYFSLLNQILSTESVPFEGEPLKGLQIMGPLETRALDFGTLVILSCNEGMFPRKTVSSSFIPPELRKGFSLPTYEFQDAVWAYYFYRMICRAKSVWMLYDSRTSGIKSGEESRYIKQLQYHFGVKINRYYAQSKADLTQESSTIEKTEEDVEIIKKAHLSASALKNYLDCPAKFYYYTVKKLRADDEVVEDLDASMIGNVYHKTMQALYLGPDAMDPLFGDLEIIPEGYIPMKEVTISYIKQWLDNEEGIKARVRSLILSELNALDVTGRNLVVEDVIVTYVRQTLKREIEHMTELGVDKFRVIGLEKQYEWKFNDFTFIGYADRVDSYAENEVRVVDYKTGKVEDKDINITDDNAEQIVAALFGKDNNGRPKIAFQLFLYDMFIQNDKSTKNSSMSNSIYAPATLFKEGVKDVKTSSKFCDLVKDNLTLMLKEMTDTSIGFDRTEQRKTCGYCDFKMICGR